MLFIKKKYGQSLVIDTLLIIEKLNGLFILDGVLYG